MIYITFACQIIKLKRSSGNYSRSKTRPRRQTFSFYSYETQINSISHIIDEKNEKQIQKDHIGMSNPFIRILTEQMKKKKWNITIDNNTNVNVWNEISRKQDEKKNQQKQTTNLFVCHCFEAIETGTDRVRKEEFERRLSKYLVGWLVRPLLWQHLVNFSSTIFTFIRISGCCYRLAGFFFFYFGVFIHSMRSMVQTWEKVSVTQIDVLS